ncbi:hypothetical protein OG883_21155 [Streptomyces sp. NBC_01142]|uniref:hypothetical protein n=1 Tax=Streptomyces sp. NBC_01142 TaxID=2975865 RepID=UPI00224EA8D5|nr:hypothetical protein [Streptomyces sp. NBC_01142]MCX4822352.1 hypothetical protein [Streptomyces sp. NBC_01142]
MTILIAAVVLVGALCLFDLLLTFAVLRRLREHTTQIAGLGGQQHFTPYDPMVLVGRKVPDLPGVGGGDPGDTGGTDDARDGSRLVAFFDAQCETCHDHAPVFAVRARGRDAVAVISGDGIKVDQLVGHVAGVASVVRGGQAQRLVDAMEIEAFPTFVQVDAEGVVVHAVNNPAELPEPAMSAAPGARALAEPAPTA